MSYRMYIRKRDPEFALLKIGKFLKVVAIYSSTDDLLRPMMDVQLEIVEAVVCPHCGHYHAVGDKNE